MSIDFSQRLSIEENGFQGFPTVKVLYENSCRSVSTSRGVYLILRLSEHLPKYLPVSSGGHFKGQNPSVDIITLEKNWVFNTVVLYIGQTGGKQSKATLQQRVKQCIDFGYGEPVGHWGGRYIWQLADAKELLICWKPLTQEDPHVIKSKLIGLFSEQYNARPFANLQG